MSKNEIVARWMGVPSDVPLAAINYSGDYQCLMVAWVKFRDLKFEDEVTALRYLIDSKLGDTWMVVRVVTLEDVA